MVRSSELGKRSISVLCLRICLLIAISPANPFICDIFETPAICLRICLSIAVPANVYFIIDSPATSSICGSIRPPAIIPTISFLIAPMTSCPTIIKGLSLLSAIAYYTGAPAVCLPICYLIELGVTLIGAPMVSGLLTT